MLSHRVEISPLALQDAAQIYEWLSEQYGSELSNAWYNGLLDVVSSLACLPRRCPLAAESKKLGREIRQLLYAKGRIVFGIDNSRAEESVVSIYRIRHQSQNALKPSDFPQE